jgi:hypothetical protein
MISGEFGKQSFAVFDVLPVLGPELNSYHATGRNMIQRFVTEFVHKITYSMVVAEDDGRIEAIVKGLYGFDEIAIAEAV